MSESEAGTSARKSSSPSLARNSVWLAVIQAANYIFPLATLPFLLRALGSDGYGILVFTQALIQYFVIVSDYGFNLSATRAVASARNDKDEVARIFWSTFMARALLSLSCFFAVCILSLTVEEVGGSTSAVLVLCALAILGNAAFPQWYFQGSERVRPLAIIQVATRGLALLGIFLTVREPDDLMYAALFQAIPFLLAGGAALVYVKWHLPVKRYRVTRHDLIASYRDGWHTFISTASVSLYTTTNVFVLGLVSNPTAVAYFSVADKVTRAASGLITPVVQAVFPRVSALASSDRPQAFDLLKKTLGLLIALAFLAGCVLLSTAPWIVQIVSGAQWSDAILALQIMSAVPFIIAFNTTWGTLTMLPFGLQKQMSVLLLAAGVLNVMLLIPAAYFLEAPGAALAVVASEFVVTASMGVALARTNLFYSPTFYWSRKVR